MASIEINDVDSFTTGTVGPKGQRIFYLQARAGSTTVSLKLEKQQVLALAQYLGGLLSDLPEISGAEWVSAPVLAEPVEPLWAVGALGAAYDQATDSVILMAEELTDEEDDDGSAATFRLSRAQTVAFIERAHEVVQAGRPPCRWCGQPLNHGEDGFCACWN